MPVPVQLSQLSIRHGRLQNPVPSDAWCGVSSARLVRRIFLTGVSFGRRGKLDSSNTACIKGYYEVEKCIENAVKSRNFVSIFDTLRKYKSIQTFLVMPFTIPRKALVYLHF